MIQRVQSIYLLLVTVLMSFFLISSYANIDLGMDQSIDFYTFAIERQAGADTTEVISQTTPLLVIILITGTLSFINIFLFRNRIVQIRICLINGLLLLAQVVLIYLYYTRIRGDFEGYDANLRISVIFPVLGIIFNFMAYRGIRHDQMLVNSYNRIR